MVIRRETSLQSYEKDFKNGKTKNNTSMPAFSLIGDFRDGGGMIDRILSFEKLFVVIFEENNGVASEIYYGGEVAECHQSHSDVGEAPHCLKGTN